MKKTKSNSGFTMVEVLSVAAIIVALAGVTFVSVHRYMRSMTKLEYDGYAKSLFVAAQNHLTVAEHEGYLGRTDFGTKEPEITDVDDTGSGVYYFVVVNGSGYGSNSSILPLMLPFGSVDDTVRSGSYIIRYHKDTAQVLDVFYWSTSGRFAHSYNDSSDYSTFLSLRGDSNKPSLRTYSSDKSVIGYYGGVQAEGLTRGEELLAPSIVVTNGDKLSVAVTNPNSGNSDARLTLIVEGEQSKKTKMFELIKNEGSPQYDETFTVVFDDITTSGKHFFNQFSSFIPGENITVYAVADSTTVLTNVAYSARQTTNSLFADGTTTDTAKISSIRHLENLDGAISNLDTNDTSNKLDIANAVQLTDLIWKDNDNGTKDFVSEIRRLNNTPENGADPSIYQHSSTTADTAAGFYYPICPNYALTYDGQNHSISNIAANSANAGLFGSTASGSEIRNLELLDFNITGTTTAGALAGTLASCTVTNVLARYTPGNTSVSPVSAPTAGGLIGSTNGVTVQKSAAALLVNGTTVAGGLIGSADGGTITGCYSGGHTDKGEYYTHKADDTRDTALYNVTGGIAGGLVGSSSASISYSYSTCSAQGNTAGGLVGTASGTISNCYCTGLVGGTGTTPVTGAFVGSVTGGSVAGQYLNIINYPMGAAGEVMSSGVSAADAADEAANGKTATENYQSFVRSGATGDEQADAYPYDVRLNGYYRGKYNLQTVSQLSSTVGVDNTDFVTAHYGDWPAPDLFFVNENKPLQP